TAWTSEGQILTENDGRRPKSVDLAKLAGNGTAAGRLRKQMKAMEAFENPAGLRALRATLGPTSAIQKMMEPHRAVIDATRILPDAYKMPEISGINVIGEAHRRITDAFRVGSFADMIGNQGVLAALAPSLGIMKTDDFTGVLEGIRARQSVLGSVVEAYMDQQRAQAERTKGMVEALAMPRIDPARLSISSALALSDTNAFRIAGLTTDYAEQYRFIFGAVNERIGALARIGAVANTFALQPDLVGGIGSLLERALAQQQALLEQQRQLAEQAADAQPRRQTLIAERIGIINAIVSVLWITLCTYIIFEERLAGGDSVALANTAAIEENTRIIEQVRQSFDGLADQLERMHAVQEEAGEKEKAADEAIAEILREIADTLADQVEGEEEAP
ncbi:MAG: hypothetical protein WBA74_14830, partial [Cyclobacteriaceae bacterium]